MVLELDSTGAQTARNIYGSNLLSRTVQGQTLNYMYNGHGDVTALIDSTSGELAGYYYYDAFGNLIDAAKHGDVNGDGVITSTDYGYVERYCFGMPIEFPSPYGKIAADVDGDNSITFTDLSYIQENILGMIKYFPADKNKDFYINDKNPYGYAGYIYDGESGLYYLNARMYDPVTARFLQEDTYTGDPNDPLSLNLYTYCHNEPIMYTDPTGHREGQYLYDMYRRYGAPEEYVDRLRKEVLENLTWDEYNKKGSYLQGFPVRGDYESPQTQFYRAFVYDPEEDKYTGERIPQHRNTFEQKLRNSLLYRTWKGETLKAGATAITLSAANTFVVQPMIFIGTGLAATSEKLFGFEGATDNAWSNLQSGWSNIQSFVESKMLTTKEDVDLYASFRPNLDTANEIYGLVTMLKGPVKGYRNLREIQVPKTSTSEVVVDAGTGTRYEIKPTIVKAYEEMGKKADAGVGNEAIRKVVHEPYDFKHVAPKDVPWKKVVKMTKDIPAKYKPEVDIQALELKAYNEGIPASNGKPFKVLDAGEVIGAKYGRETQYMRVEISSNGLTDTLHSHPITLEEFKKYTK